MGELTEQLAKVVSEVFVHERIDERIGDVVGEVHIEDSHVVRHKLQGHKERRREGDDEYDSNDKQHGGRLQVGHAYLVFRLLQYRSLDLAVGHAGVHSARAVAGLP